MMKLDTRVIASSVGILCIVTGVIISVIFPNIVRKMIREELVLQNGSRFYNTWVEPQVPIFTKIYLFNVTNPQDVVNNKSKPILKEIGPYTYSKYTKKIDIVFNKDDTVSYKDKVWYQFQPDKTPGSLMDNVTILNIPFSILAMKADGKLDLLGKIVLPQMLKIYNATPFITKTVDEVLFKGYQDKLFQHSQLRTPVMPNGTFGLFYRRNQSIENFTVFTGKKYPEKFMLVHKWNNLSELDIWDSKYCNMINGSDGSAYGPFITKDDRLYIFSRGFCRSVYLEYEEQQHVHGIKAYRFYFPGSSKSVNECFCNKNGTCLKSGVLDLSPCLKGAPIVASGPHFHNGHDSYYESIIGLNRSKNHHKSLLDIEPILGVPMRFHIRGQLNIAIKPTTHIVAFKNFTEMLFPVMWVDECSEWTSEFALDYYNLLFRPQEIVYILCYVLLSLGSLIVLVVILHTAYDRLNGKKRKSRRYMDRNGRLHLTDGKKLKRKNKRKKWKTQNYGFSVPTE